ncbi:hypothetical protein GGX14DRAFT_398610 [Mycena pura]|uniref:Uncharacterized protein n=1 Tax=Mycena pura TaxID=153505 RepID=A0AAD6Y6E4_9AGAR|nr:hypothetical protein GGX14DRAFT_398610 [Mycena pura]
MRMVGTLGNDTLQTKRLEIPFINSLNRLKTETVGALVVALHDRNNVDPNRSSVPTLCALPRGPARSLIPGPQIQKFAHVFGAVMLRPVPGGNVFVWKETAHRQLFCGARYASTGCWQCMHVVGGSGPGHRTLWNGDRAAGECAPRSPHLHNKVFMTGLPYALCTRVCIPVVGRIVCETLTAYDALRMHMLDHAVACAECVCPARGAGGKVEKDKTYCQLSGSGIGSTFSRRGAFPATSRDASEAECSVALSSGFMSLQGVSSDPPVGSRARCINPCMSRMTIKSEPGASDLLRSQTPRSSLLSRRLIVLPLISSIREVNPGSSDVQGLQTSDTNGGRADITSRVQFGEFEVMREVNVKRREYVSDPPPFIAVHEERTAIVVDLRDGKFEGLRDAQGKLFTPDRLIKMRYLFVPAALAYSFLQNNDTYRESTGNGWGTVQTNLTFKCRQFRLDCKDPANVLPNDVLLKKRQRTEGPHVIDHLFGNYPLRHVRRCAAVEHGVPHPHI